MGVGKKLNWGKELRVGRIFYTKNLKLKPQSNSEGANASNFFVGILLGHCGKGVPGIGENELKRKLGQVGFVDLDVVMSVVGEEMALKIIEKVKGAYPLPGDNEEIKNGVELRAVGKEESAPASSEESPSASGDSSPDVSVADDEADYQGASTEQRI